VATLDSWLKTPLTAVGLGLGTCDQLVPSQRRIKVRVIVAAHAFVQNLRRGFYDLGIDVRPPLRLTAAFAELALVV